MGEKIEQAIEKMAEQARSCQDSQKALHFSQAALNLAHAKQLLEDKPKKQGAGA